MHPSILSFENNDNCFVDSQIGSLQCQRPDRFENTLAVWGRRQATGKLAQTEVITKCFEGRVLS